MDSSGRQRAQEHIDITNHGDRLLRQRKEGNGESKEQMEGILYAFIILLFKINMLELIITEISGKFEGLELMILEIRMHDWYF